MKKSLFSTLMDSPLIANIMKGPLIVTKYRKPHPLGSRLLGALLFGFCVIIASSIFSWSFYRSHQEPRYVNVKGLAEREVVADIAIWPISFFIMDNDLAALQRQLTKQQNKIVDFLKQRGFQHEDISYGIPNIEDSERSYGDTTHKKFRYTAYSSITLRSHDVYAVEQALQQTDQLLSQGIALSDRWDAKPQFIFTKLNDIKPEMIQEANISAKRSADQFTADSGSQISTIRHATQGLFEIKDTHLPTKKQVRVVTTVQYLLKD